MIRALIVDSDPTARTWLTRQLTAEPDFEVVGECADGFAALENIEMLRPDVVFTDVELQKLSGLEMLRSPGMTQRPHVIITATSEKYAVQAFEANVTDYLLKPYEPQRFRIAMLKLRSNIERDSQLDRRVDLDLLLTYLKGNSQKTPANRAADRVPVKFGRRYRFISMAGIRHIEAKGDYVNIHMLTGEVMHSGDRISEIERKLPFERFLRVHRSIIINVEHVREVRAEKNDYEIVMHNGQSFRPGTTYKTKVKKALIYGRNSGNRDALIPSESLRRDSIHA